MTSYQMSKRKLRKIKRIIIKPNNKKLWRRKEKQCRFSAFWSTTRIQVSPSLIKLFTLSKKKWNREKQVICFHNVISDKEHKDIMTKKICDATSQNLEKRRWVVSYKKRIKSSLEWTQSARKLKNKIWTRLTKLVQQAYYSTRLDNAGHFNQVYLILFFNSILE